MSKLLRYGGLVASVILIAFGIGAVTMGLVGRDTVLSNLRAEKIVGTPDMTPKAIKAEAQAAGLKNVDLPTCSVAGKAIDNGTDARCFAQYMRVHALEATGGQVYAEMARYVDAKGNPTNDVKQAAIDPKTKQPVENAKRNVWVNETALSTALNTAYFAESVGLFSVVMGVALLLTGVGFLIVALIVLPRRRRDAEADRAAIGTGAVAAV